MKRFSNILLTGVLFAMLTACGSQLGGDVETAPDAAPRPSQQAVAPTPVEPDTSGDAEPGIPTASSAGIPITVTVGEQVFPATLLDSETARQLAERLPLTLDMSELNGNEK